MKNIHILEENIYITSDEEIKEGDYILTPHQGVIKWEGDNEHLLKEYCKKVILTTDQNLIKDGVQAVEEDFLNWFVKNLSCEEKEEPKQDTLNHFLSTSYVIVKDPQKFDYKNTVLPKEAHDNTDDTIRTI